MEQSTMFKDGIIAIAVYVLLGFLTLLVPIVGLVTFFFAAVPLALFTYRYSWKSGAVALSGAFLLFFLLAGPVSLLSIFLNGITGIIIGELYRQKKSAFGVFAGSALSTIGGILALYLGAIIFLNVNPVEEIQTAMTESVEQTEELFGVTQDQEEALAPMLGFIDELTVIAPALIVMFGTGIALFIQLVIARFLKKRKLPYAPFPPLREWSLPKSFFWYYLLTFVFLFAQPEPGTTFYTVGANLTPVLEAAMFIQGVTFLFFFFHMKKLNKIIPILITVFALLLPIFLPIIRILGIIDLGFDLRKRLNSQN
ncbi:YybS family protein [Paenalkalicoccus suaedae]|uniref:YybS family protein n=1 Tax=Paenalkalicoccus suaedae TaxID=2592382 RepID=A0A859FJY6_9BACI|nr:YybS family protein [Paenalkalicoccus suaedae]QKS73096.1 YybS family protein [Paenalkalicoccus suaedae]